MGKTFLFFIFIYILLCSMLYVPISVTLLEWNVTVWPKEARGAWIWITILCLPPLAMCIMGIVKSIKDI